MADKVRMKALEAVADVISKKIKEQRAAPAGTFRGKSLPEWATFVENAKASGKPLEPVAKLAIPALADAVQKSKRGAISIATSKILDALGTAAVPVLIEELGPE